MAVVFGLTNTTDRITNGQHHSNNTFHLPAWERPAGDRSGGVVEIIVADGAPDSVVADLQTTFTFSLTSDKTKLYTVHTNYTASSQGTMRASIDLISHDFEI